MKNRTVKYVIPAIAALGLMLLPSFSDAQSWSYSIGTKKVTPRMMQSFITKSGNASDARSDGTNFQQNDKIHFYYKVGPMASISGKGAPFKTRLVVKQGSRTLKDFGWQSANAANSDQMGKNLTLTWYHSAAWNLTLSPNINPGRYSAVVSHQDLNSGKTLNANFSFSVKAASGGAASSNSLDIRADLTAFADYFKTRRLDRVMSFVGARTYIDYCQKEYMDKNGVENFLRNSFLSTLYPKNYPSHRIQVNPQNPHIIFNRSKQDQETGQSPVVIKFKIENNRLIVKEISSGCQG